MTDYGWVLTAEVIGRECDPSAADDVVLTEVGGGNRTLRLRADDNGKLFLNGKFVDVGDDFPALLGVMDEVMESPTGAVLFKTDDTAEYVSRNWPEGG